MRRGFSLLEAIVVLAITVTALAIALPILLALLREQKGLASEVLRGDTLPLLHARLDRDLGEASALSAAVQESPPALLVTLAPRTEKGPSVLWTFAGKSLSRREVPADGSPGPPPHDWSVEGTLDVVREELPRGRLAILWQPPGTAAELMVFELPRSEEALR